MLVQSILEQPQSAHVVVLGNEKGGSGKSTTALAYEVESVAVARNLPLVRSGSVLGRDAQDIKKMCRDAYRLNDAGQQALAAALFGAFR